MYSEPDNFLEPEYAKAYETWKKDPSQANNDLILHTIRPVVDSALQSYAAGVTSPAVRTQAKVMALQALNRYDPSRSKLRTHLMTQMQSLRRLSARQAQIVRIPEQLALDRNTLVSEEQKLRDELGREPSDMEISDRMGLSLRRIEKIRKSPASLAESTISQIGSDSEGNPYQPAVRADSDRPWAEFVYYGLPPTDQIIMAHTLGLFGQPKLSTAAIAKKLRITSGAVSQRAKRIQDKLDQRTTRSVL